MINTLSDNDLVVINNASVKYVQLSMSKQVFFVKVLVTLKNDSCPINRAVIWLECFY